MENFVVEINRQQKAIKIQKILEDFIQKPLTNYKILDIGCGNGLIAAYLAAQGNFVTAVDVSDQRDLNAAGDYKFVKISNECLPFDPLSFDIVISNHVIEHVDRHTLHVSEIIRVLKPQGLCYLATPNRYFPYEVHYKLPFLHWLPQNLFVTSLKLIGKYSYPVKLLGYWGFKKLIKPYFAATEYTDKIIRQPEKFAFEKLPVWFSRLYRPWLNFISPTIIFVLEKKTDGYRHNQHA